MTDGEKEVFKSYLKPKHNVLEWGTGDSTRFMRTLVDRVTSIEHDGAWAEKNPDLECRVVPVYGGYVECPVDWGMKFDIVLIDGRERVACGLAVLYNRLLAPGGTVFVHDWARAKYHSLLERYKIIELVPQPKGRPDKGLVALQPK